MAEGSGFFPGFDKREALTSEQTIVMEQITKMLARLQPTKVEPGKTVARLRGRRLLLAIPHAENESLGIAVEVQKGAMEVCVGPTEVGFFSSKSDDWLNDGLGFIWACLTGKVELVSVWRGRIPRRTRTYFLDDDGTRKHIETMGLLIPANPFRRKTTQTIRVSFVD
jgi:hypothetical protein